MNSNRRKTLEPEYDEIMTTKEVQKFLRIGRTKMWRMTKSGVLPAYSIGDSKQSPLRYKKSEVLAWLDRRRIVPTTPKVQEVKRHKS